MTVSLRQGDKSRYAVPEFIRGLYFDAHTLGADFSYFTMSNDRIAFTDEGLVLAAVVGQLEFARFRVPEWRMFHTYSLYTEWQLWFISSDVEAGLLPKLSFGFRLGPF